MILIKNCAYVVTQNKKRRILCNTDVLVDGNRIIQIGKNLAAKTKTILDGREKILMPGLINMHTHVGMTHMRGISDDDDFHEWLAKVWAEEKKLTAAMVFESASKAYAEMIASGTTTFLDMYFFCEEEALAAGKMGVRGFIGYGMIDLFDRKKRLSEIAKNKKFIAFMKKKKFRAVSYAIAPHAPYTVSPELLRIAKWQADKYKTICEIHILETEKEKKDMEQRYGMGIVQYLDKIKFFGENVVSVHNVWMDEADLKIIAKNKTTLVHCPKSNMKLATGGIMPVVDAIRKGINLTLGTDSSASNNDLNMFSEMKVAALLQKHRERNATAINAQQVLDMATVNGAKALNLNSGSIEEGKLADLILLTITENLKPISSHKVVGHLVYSTSGHEVCDVIINGKLVMRNKQLLL